MKLLMGIARQILIRDIPNICIYIKNLTTINSAGLEIIYLIKIDRDDGQTGREQTDATRRLIFSYFRGHAMSRKQGGSHLPYRLYYNISLTYARKIKYQTERT